MTSFQIVVDCADPDPLARFWAVALGYVLEPAPDGFDGWDAYWREVGVAEDELGQGEIASWTRPGLGRASGSSRCRSRSR